MLVVTFGSQRFLDCFNNTDSCLCSVHHSANNLIKYTDDIPAIIDVLSLFVGNCQNHSDEIRVIKQVISTGYLILEVRGNSLSSVDELHHYITLHFSTVKVILVEFSTTAQSILKGNFDSMQSPSEDGGKDPPNAKQAHQNISYLIDEWVSPQHILNKLRDHIFELDAEHIFRSMEINGYSMVNIFDYLSQSERKIYDCINNFLEEMKKHHDDANIMKTRYQTYVYDATEYLGAPYSLDHPIYVNYFQLCLHDLITMVGKKYLGSDNIYMFNNYLSLLYCGKHKSTRVKSQNWHRDPDGRRLFKFFIFMNDASETNGALEYIPRSQFTSTNRSTTVYDYGESFFGGGYPSKIMGPELGEFQELADKHGTVMTCPAGTLLFVDTSGFHRAGVSQPGKYRKYLVGQFRTLHDLGLLEAYHKQSTLKYPDCHYKGFNFSANYCVSPDKVESILGPIGKYFYYPSKQSCTLTHPPTFFCQKHPLDVPNIYQPFPVVATDETPEQRRLRIKQAVSARHRLKKGK